MFKEITKDNWLLYAQQAYDNPTLEKEVEFYDDSQKNISDVNAAKAQALEQGMVGVFDVYLVVDGVPQEA